MSEEQLKAFIAKAKDDQAIREKIKVAKTSEEVVEIAKKHGYELTVDIAEVFKQSKLAVGDLTEDEIEGVTGGGFGCAPNPTSVC